MRAKSKVIAITVGVFITFLILTYFLASSSFFGRKISRATGGLIATNYDAPDDAIRVISVSPTTDSNGNTAKNITYLMKDCTVMVFEYRDGVKGLFESRMKITHGMKPFKQDGCVEKP